MAGLFANFFRLQVCSKLSFFFKKKGNRSQRPVSEVFGLGPGAVQEFTAKPGGYHLLAKPGGTHSLQGCADMAGSFVADLELGFGVHVDFSGFGSDASHAIK